MAKLRGTLKSATAGAQYLSEGGQLADLPISSTKQVPLNTTTGQLILGDFSHDQVTSDNIHCVGV